MAREQRKLAAILAADVVGYSRLIGRDESGTVSRLRELRLRRLEPLVARHGGRIVKLMGDGALIEFASAVDALAAAIEFQQAMREANQLQADDTAIAYRIGLHLGDLIVEGDDLLGDAANVANRLQEQAPAGGIVVSRTVKEAVAGRIKAAFEDRGRLELKNIDRPVPAFGVTWQARDWPVATPVRPSRRAVDGRRRALWIAAVAAAGGILLAGAGYLALASRPASPVAAHITPLPADKPSIAVLPFRNLSGDAQLEYLTDALVEDIIATLSRIPDFVVIARSSSHAYKGRSVDVRQVASELGVRYVVDGSFRIEAKAVRLNCMLIDGTSGKQIWAERYDGAVDNVFELQDRITSSIVGTIQPEVQKAEIARAQAKPTGNLSAYDLYLRAIAAITPAPTESSLAEGLALLERAVAVDPRFAAAYGEMVAAHSNRVLYGWADITETFARGYEAAKTALELGNDDPVALALGGYGIAFFGSQPEKGLTHIERALALNPNSAMAWRLGATVYWWTGRHEKSIASFQRAMQLSPRDVQSFVAYTGISYANFFLGRHEQAIAWTARALQERPRYFPALLVRVAALAMDGSRPGELQDALYQMRSLPHLDLPISGILSVFPAHSPADRELLATALRKAGFAEK